MSREDKISEVADEIECLTFAVRDCFIAQSGENVADALMSISHGLHAISKSLEVLAAEVAFAKDVDVS